MVLQSHWVVPACVPQVCCGGKGPSSMVGRCVLWTRQMGSGVHSNRAKVGENLNRVTCKYTQLSSVGHKLMQFVCMGTVMCGLSTVFYCCCLFRKLNTEMLSTLVLPHACSCDVEVDPQPQQSYISSWFRSKESLGYKPDQVSCWCLVPWVHCVGRGGRAQMQCTCTWLAGSQSCGMNG